MERDSRDRAAIEELEARAAHFEREENFRWLSSILSQTSPHPLTKRVSPATERAIYALAEFAEVAHGSIDPAWVLEERNRRRLGGSGFPLEGYSIIGGIPEADLEPVELTEKFHGTRGGLQGYCALRLAPKTPAQPVLSGTSPSISRPQLILALSGTSNARLAMYDVMAAPVGYKTAYDDPSKHQWRVHDGFQRVFRGVRRPAFEALTRAISTMEARLKEYPIQEWDLVITAHSLGAAVSYLAILDLLHEAISHEPLDPIVPILPRSTRVNITVLGCPRAGNPALAKKHFRWLIEEFRHQRGSAHALTEWSVIGHMDGVPSLPPTAFGYAHFSERPYYAFGGHLYEIPRSESEYTHFKVIDDEDDHILFPRGGHNYYGGRDMERLQRRLRAIFLDLGKAPVSTPEPTRTTLVRHRSHSDIRSRTLSLRIRKSSAGFVKRSASMPGSVAKLKSTTLADQRDGMTESPGAAEEDTPPRNTPMEPLAEEPEHEWVQRYLERESQEQEVWAARKAGQTHWGALKTLIPFGIFK